MNAIPIYVVPQVANIFDMGLEARMHMTTASLYGRSHFNLYRHTNNVFDFLLRDIDRQPKTQTGTVELVIYDELNNIILTVPLVIADQTRAHYRCTISATNSVIDLGNYTWVIRHTDTTVRLLYTNQYYETRGTMTVREGLPPPIDPTIVITTFLANDGGYTSDWIPTNQRGNHTLVIRAADYSETIAVDVTQDISPPTSSDDYTTLTAYQTNDLTGNQGHDFTGLYTYVRFRTSGITGLESLSYRN